MTKKYFYKIIGLLIVITLVISISCKKKYQTEDRNYHRMSHLARTFSYKQILKEFSDYPWSQEKDPEMLMLYCEALVESREGFPSFLKSLTSKTYIGEFAQGYFDLLKGELIGAADRFARLTGNQESRVWGYIGLLEFSLYTERIADVKEFLESLKMAAYQEPSSVPSWAIPYYSAWYFFYSGDFSKVNRILEEHRQQVDQITYLILQINLLERGNRFKDAGKVIKNLPPEFLDDQYIIALESDIIQFSIGAEQWKKYLNEKHVRFPNMWIIEQSYAEALIESGQVQLGLNIFKELAEKRPFDILIQLDLAEILLDYGEGKDSEEFFKKLFSNPNVKLLPKFHILLARIYHLRGQEEKKQIHLNIARELYPKNTDLLWLMFNHAMEAHDYANASQTINEILELYPNEVSALVALMKLNYLKNEWDKLLVTEEIIKKSNRYISVETWDEVKSFKALALAAQGKISEAYKVLSDIKSPGKRTEITTKIKKQGHEK